MKLFRRILLLQLSSLLGLAALASWVVAASPAGGLFADTGQSLGSDSSYDLVLFDVDGDGDHDLVTANHAENRVWLNDGQAGFSDSGQRLGFEVSRGIASGDLNGDLAPDLFVANSPAANQVWLNDGTGSFSWDGQLLTEAAQSHDAALAQLGGNGALDVVVANVGPNSIWLNDGNGGLVLTQSLGSVSSFAVAVGDVDADGDQDLYFANGTSFTRDELWLNEAGRFVDSGQLLDPDWNEGAALGDLDGDNDPDLFLATWDGDDAVWLNQGGVFSDTGQSLSGPGSLDVALLDVDDDGDRDAIVTKWSPDSDEIWLNDGSGNFSLSPETLDSHATFAVAAGDLDGDLDHDLALGNFGGDGIWLKGGLALPAPWFKVAARLNPAGRYVYPWVQNSPAELPVVLSWAPLSALSVLARVDGPGSIITTSLPFAPGQLNSSLMVSNPPVSPSLSLTLTLFSQNGRVLAGADRHNPLTLTFVDEGAGDQGCLLCYTDWLVKLMGFDTQFWRLHHMGLADLRATLAWSYYQRQFGAYGGEIAAIVARDPILLWQSYDTLESWTPAIQAFDDGQGQQVIISAEMTGSAVALFEAIRDGASPALANRIQGELDALDFPSLAGQSMDAAMARIEGRVGYQLHLPVAGQR